MTGKVVPGPGRKHHGVAGPVSRAQRLAAWRRIWDSLGRDEMSLTQIGKAANLTRYWADVFTTEMEIRGLLDRTARGFRRREVSVKSLERLAFAD